jgi:CNT family concentrative nucleoside transporter
MGLFGIVAILAAAYALSSNRGAIRPRQIAWGLGLQLTLAVLVLKTPFGRVFEIAGAGFNNLMKFGEEGSGFLFGELGRSENGVIMAFQILPLIIFVSALFAVLYHLGIMQLIVKGLAIVMQRGMQASGAESLNVAANVFLGQSEAPLTIRPYLKNLTKSELMTVMTGGMGTISGALLVAYVQVGGVPVEHLLTAVIMTAPACIMLAKVIEPETGHPETMGGIPEHSGVSDRNLVDAAARGASEGLMLALNVGAVLIAFVALIAVVNGMLAGIQSWTAWAWFPTGLQGMLGPLFAPVAWLLGVPWVDAGAVGNLLGTRMVLNEFIGFAALNEMKAALDPKSFLIAGYALCGFANFGSIGIQVGGIGSLVPERRGELAQLGFRAMLAGTLANFLTAAIAGLLVSPSI